MDLTILFDQLHEHKIKLNHLAKSEDNDDKKKGFSLKVININ